uniref:Si:dkey-191g9.5 n=1 Tax=Erpetoichthys calabaricus TaxID=27687 RepID=A0A8C4SCJ2_ERPCA
SSDQELLLHAGRAIGRICFDNNGFGGWAYTPFTLSVPDVQQEALVSRGVIPRLMGILQQYPENDPLVNVCLLALCNLADLGEFLHTDFGNVPHLRLIVTSILFADEPMQKCFRDGTGQLYEAILSWLQEDNTDLQRSGALAIANFARNDNNCTRMVAQGAVFQILALLERHVKDGDVAVQHAALSALRNLAIPAANKVQMLEDGLLERIRMLLCSEMPPVQFKLLGMLRMMVDGQEEAAAVLGTDQALLSKITEWCGSQEHAGVRGEANRLLAALIRHSRCWNFILWIANGGKHLISMARSEHVIMQNEALIALAIASGSFKDGGIVPTLQQMLDDPMVASEVKFSALGLVCSLANSG